MLNLDRFFFAQCLKHTPPFLIWFVHASLLHRIVFICGRHSPKGIDIHVESVLFNPYLPQAAFMPLFEFYA
jgi:hypothetical protein